MLSCTSNSAIFILFVFTINKTSVDKPKCYNGLILNLEILVMNDVVDLESFVVGYLKRRKYKRSSELLTRVISKRNSEQEISRTMVKFKKYFMEWDKKIKQEVNDDLGFEINFGAGPTYVKVTLIFSFN